MMSDRLQKGQVLKQIREQKGISLDSVHEATKIPLDALKAIEEGYKVRTLTDFYYRAFVKMYANYLDIDITSVLEDYQPEVLPQPQKFHKGKTFWDEDVPVKISKEAMRKIVKWIFIVLAFFLFIRMAGCIFRKKPQAAQGKKVNITQKKTVFATKRTSAPKKAVSKPQPKTSRTVTPQKIEKRVRLVVRAKQRSWLKVEVDGQIVFRSILARGASEKWDAAEKIELSGKNIKDLELELNGRLLAPLGDTTRRVKSIIVTRSGFRIKD